MITIQDYIKYAFQNKLHRKLNWFYTLFTIKEECDNMYMKLMNNKAYVYINGELQEIPYKPLTPIITMSMVIKINGEFMSNLDKEVETTIGRILVNKLLLADIFGNKIPFKDSEVKIGSLESEIATKLSNKEIPVSEYLEWVDVCQYVTDLSRITTVSATEKNLLPPTGLKQFKEKTIKEFTDKYGEDWVRDRAKVVEFENILKDFDTAYLQGDPSLGILVSGKVKDGARTKMFLTFGSEVAFDKKSGSGKLVMPSLLEGYPKDPENLVNMLNTSRSGSYDRGKNTQKGGSAAKDILRATSSIKITSQDCGVRIGKIKTINKDNHKHILNRYIIEGNTLTLVTDTESYIGKTVRVRSPQYCREKHSSICPVCSGESLAKYPTGISIIMTDVSAILLATSMAAMHFKTLETLDFDIRETIR